MIRLTDATILAYTKLRTHRVRTGITIGVAGILFGLILAIIMIAQGVFTSVEQFGKEGLGDRALVNISRFDGISFNAWEHLEGETFIAEIEAYHQAHVTKKAALAKKYQVEYDAKVDDPSPIVVDKTTNKKRIREGDEMSQFVQAVALEKSDALYKPFDIDGYLKPYQTATVIPDNYSVMPTNGEMVYMKDGVEQALQDEGQRMLNKMGSGEDPTMMVMNESLTKPFTVNASFDVSRGEVPVIVSYGLAEKLLGLKKMDKDSTNEQRLARLAEVRSRVGEITASYCYRNAASQQLLSEALSQELEKKRNKDDKEYVAPKLQYTVPAEDSCGAVAIASDARTTAEKQLAARQQEYETELGIDRGEPVQYKVTLRGVGMSGDMNMTGIDSSIGGMVTSLLGSWLSYGDNFVVPANLLAQLPAESRPDYLFSQEGDNAGGALNQRFRINSYFVEFGDKQEARKALERGGMFGGAMADNRVGVTPFGSGTLMVDEMKTWFWRILLWTLAVVGGIALIILAGLIGRMVSDGRRESAIFRAIGARRSDISAIYSMYALLLSLRVALFALVLGIVIAMVVEWLYWQDATFAARVAYAAADTSKEFHFLSLASWYIPMVLGAIIVVGLLASIIPILLGARRNPINDMRNE